MKLIKILWFSNAEFPAVSIYFGRKPNTGRGAWMKILLENIKYNPDIEIHIATSHFIFKKEITIVDSNVTYYTLSRSKFNQYSKANRHDMNKIRDLVKKVKPDIIHVFGTEQHYGLISTLSLDIPVVVRAQGILNSYVKYFFGEISLLKFNYKDFYLYFLFLSRLKQERKIFSNNTFFEGQSDWDNGWINKLSPNAVYYRNAPIIRDVFKIHNWNRAQCDKNTILAISSNVSYKGLHVLLNAIPNIRKAFPKVTINLICDLPDSGYGKYLRSLIKKHKMEESIISLGYLDEKGLVETFSKASVLVIPSFIENESLLKLEAGTFGLPTIATYSGGMPSATGEKETGLFFPPGDSETLSAVIVKFFKSFSIYADKAENDRNYLLNYLDNDKIIEKTLYMYKDVINKYRSKNKAHKDA